MPLSAPTISPSGAETVVAAVAEGTIEATNTAALLAANPVAAAQAGRLMILLEGCSGAPVDSLPMALHPTGLRIDGFALPVHAGCVVANAGIVVAVCLLQLLASRVAATKLAGGILHGEGLVRYPSGTFICAIVLSQGATLSGARLVRHGENAMDAVLGIAAAVAGVVVVAWMRSGGNRSQTRAVYKLDPKTRGGCEWAWVGPGEWLSLTEYRVERWTMAFRAALPRHSDVLSLDVLLTQVAAFNAGIGGGSCRVCAFQRLVDVALALVMVGVVWKRKPYSRPLRLPMTLSAQLLLGFGALVLAVGFMRADCDGPPPAAAAPALAGGGMIMLLAAALDASSVVRVLWTGRSNRLKSAKDAVMRLLDGKVCEIRRAVVLEAVEQLLGYPPDLRAFARAYNKADASGNDVVSLHTFFEFEAEFWGLPKASPKASSARRSSLATTEVVSTFGSQFEGTVPASPSLKRKRVNANVLSQHYLDDVATPRGGGTGPRSPVSPPMGPTGGRGRRRRTGTLVGRERAGTITVDVNFVGGGSLEDLRRGGSHPRQALTRQGTSLRIDRRRRLSPLSRNSTSRFITTASTPRPTTRPSFRIPRARTGTPDVPPGLGNAREGSGTSESLVALTASRTFV
eukprot:TRINITY_DN4691_c0_g1_i1.p1 TRINITY_DN4691_c0_g1~~TRINITY_DN4691_c0_g1_i1.p1  ORF type:complete len:628 (+),score=91.44 TRINITY_DN4691_c0_g1_i1:636-2519(+)